MDSAVHIICKLRTIIDGLTVRKLSVILHLSNFMGIKTMTYKTMFWYIFGISFVLFALGLSLKLPQNGLARFLVMLVKLLLIIICGGLLIMTGFSLFQYYFHH